MTSDFTDHERDVTGYFFLRLQNLYGSKYLQQYPEEQDIKLAKREWAHQIGKYTRDQVHEMFEAVKRILASSDAEQADKYRWPDIGAILALHAQSWEHRVHAKRAAETDRMLRDERLRLTDQTKIERTKKTGAAHLDAMKNMFTGTAAGMVESHEQA